MNKVTVALGLIIAVLGWGVIGYCAFQIQQSYSGIDTSNLAVYMNATEKAQQSWSISYPWVMLFAGFPACIGTILVAIGYLGVSFFDFSLDSENLSDSLQLKGDNKE